MAPDREKISELAHLIWESEGRPEGQSERHWKMAEKTVEILSQVETASTMNGGGGRDDAVESHDDT
jgi:Protein of unknown function (DUF2934)